MEFCSFLNSHAAVRRKRQFSAFTQTVLFRSGFQERLIDNEGLPGLIVRWRTDSPRNSVYFIFTLLNELRQEVFKTFSLVTQKTTRMVELIGTDGGQAGQNPL
jgi:hypothetical protein